MRLDLWSRYLRRDAMNTVANLPLLPRPARTRLLRAFGVRIGDAAIEPGVWFAGPHVTIDDGVYINADAHLDANAPIMIGAGTRIGPRATILTSSHAIGPHEARCGEHTGMPVTIGAGCWLGAGVTFLPGVTVADGCVIGAGSIVTRDTEPDGLYVGSPARRIRDL